MHIDIFLAVLLCACSMAFGVTAGSVHALGDRLPFWAAGTVLVTIALGVVSAAVLVLRAVAALNLVDR